MESDSKREKSRVEIRWPAPVEKTDAEPPERPEPKRVRVAAYCRVSTEYDKQINSLEMQKRHYLTLVHNTPEWELVGIYSDKGVTGTDRTKRLGFQRMIRHCEEGKIDKVLCKSISRFGRNTADILEVIQSLKERNIGVAFEKECIDTLQENSEFVLSALAAIAQDESRTQSEIVSWAYQKRAQQGIPVFNRMLGYNVEKIRGKRVITINEEEAAIVREIYDLALDGMSDGVIKERMIEKGYRKTNGKNEWTGIFIKAILTNERYTGNCLTNKIYSDNHLSHKVKTNYGERPQYLIENYHPAIISHEIFNGVQRFIGKTKRGTNKKREKNTFSGRLKCGECGAVYNRRTYGKEPSWRCGKSIKSRQLCSSNLVYESQLKEIMKKAFELRYGHSNTSMIHRIYQDISQININDNFEKQRLVLDNKLATALRIENSTNGHEHQRAKVKRQELEEKISRIETYWKLVEDDRNYRVQALEWLDKLPRRETKAETIFQTMSKETMRALVMDITIFSRGAYFIRWADDTETKIEDHDFNLLMEENYQHSEPVLKVRKLKALEDSVTKTDLISQAIKVYPRQTASYKPQTWVIPEIQEDDECGANRKKVCAYCRVSTHINGQLSSFELQVNHYTEYILSHQAWKFSGIYADEGASGISVNKRPNFLRMIEDCRLGKIDLIITKSISRFSRNTVDCLTYVRMLKALPSPVGVYFERENINTLEDKSDFLLTIFSGLAQDESRSLAESVRWGIKRQYEHGIVSRSMSFLLGYDVDKFGKWTINEDAETIKRIFHEYLGGKPLRQIARDLTKEGLKTGKGKTTWRMDTLYRILRNEKYSGAILLLKTIRPRFMDKSVKNRGQEEQYFIEDHHPAIISKEDWQKVQQEFNRQHRPERVKTGTRIKEPSVFAQKIVCGDCANYFIRQRETTKAPEKNDYYRWFCRAAGGFVPGIECHNIKSYHQDKIENAFMAMILELKHNPNELIKEVRQAAKLKELNSYDKRRVEILQQQLKTLHKRMNEEVFLTKKDNSTESLGEVLLKFSQENDRLQSKLDKLQQSDQALIIDKNLNWLLDELINHKIIDPLNQGIQFREDIFSRIVNRCVVVNNGRIIFELNIGISREIDFE